MEKHIEREVNKTLDSLDGMERLQTKPYFYTRLRARMEQTESSPIGLKWSLAGVLLIVLLNVAAYVRYWPEASTDEYAMDQLTSEYSLEWPSIYRGIDE